MSGIFRRYQVSFVQRTRQNRHPRLTSVQGLWWNICVAPTHRKIGTNPRTPNDACRGISHHDFYPWRQPYIRFQFKLSLNQANSYILCGLHWRNLWSCLSLLRSAFAITFLNIRLYVYWNELVGFIVDIDGFTCDFNSRNLCGWTQDHSDDFDWIRTYVSHY